jgi:hypothetical protein
MATFDVTLRDNGVATFDVALSGGTPPAAVVENWGLAM